MCCQSKFQKWHWFTAMHIVTHGLLERCIGEPFEWITLHHANALQVRWHNEMRCLYSSGSWMGVQNNVFAQGPFGDLVHHCCCGYHLAKPTFCIYQPPGLRRFCTVCPPLHIHPPPRPLAVSWSARHLPHLGGGIGQRLRCPLLLLTSAVCLFPSS